MAANLVQAVVPLTLGPEDEVLNKEEVACIGLFQRLKRPPSVERFPGSHALRRLRPGQVICRQGEAGSTAFYVLTRADVMAFRQKQVDRLQAAAATGRVDLNRIQSFIDEKRRELSELQELSSAGVDRNSRSPVRVATARLFGASVPVVARPSVWSRLGGLFGGGRGRELSAPKSIPNDGPVDIDYDRREAPLFEGDVFGEMSCLTYAPRSATVVADCDCYALEFQRNIFDKIQSDEGYRAWKGEEYAKRVLATHLERLQFFSELDDRQLAMLRERAELQTIEPGQVICGEGDPADCVYIIRSGLVQVVVGIDAKMDPSEVQDWPGFCRTLIDSETAAAKSRVPPAAADRDQEVQVTGTQDRPLTSGATKELKTKRAESHDDAPAKPAPAKPAAAKPTSAKPTSAKPAPAKPAAAKPAVEEILAAARAKKRAAVDSTPAGTPQGSAAISPTGKPASSSPPTPTGKMSVDQILEAARPKKKEASESVGANQAAKTKEKIAATDIDPTRVAQPEVAAMLAKARDAAKPKNELTPIGRVWASLPRDTKDAMGRLVQQAPGADPRDQQTVIAGLLATLRLRAVLQAAELQPVLQSPVVQDKTGTFPGGIKGIKDWSDVQLRVAARAVLHALFPDFIGPSQQTVHPPRTLAYLSRGDCFGELGVVHKAARNATCVAYLHPRNPSGATSARVELVRIDADVFLQLLAGSPSLQAKVQRLERQRLDELRRESTRDSWDPAGSLLASPELRDSGFVQGQKLLLIDLDRCTNCGDCVRACVESHDDGLTRLYLDGPRFDRFLVPSACRNCLDPACMIGCPVGAIQRGDQGQIVIRDWCIGCEICYKQCPYDSIQMHDRGVIPERSHGWQVAPLAEPPGQERPPWVAAGFRDRNWIETAAPLNWTLDLQRQLAARDARNWRVGGPQISGRIGVRHRFTPRARKGGGGEGYILEAKADARLQLRAWLNGQPLAGGATKKKGAFSWQIAETEIVAGGSNIVAFELAADEANEPVLASGDLLLSVRLDHAARHVQIRDQVLGVADEAELKLVTKQAAVCDLCSSLPSRAPACVTECPHEAAIRIDARGEFDAFVTSRRVGV